ncbi:MAG: hypothetical protein KAR19_00065 [Bacteroidales bacterium]|nr:hypothetical protein [Bacteroidales bacterium]
MFDGPGVDGKTILLDQSEYINRLSGVQESVLEFTSAYYSEKGIGDYNEKDIEQSKKNLLASIPESSYEWMRFFIMFDPYCETGLPGEYGSIEETFDQKTLGIMSNWILQLYE